MKRKVITGNMGSGKSTVLKLYKENGYEIISADEISAEILRNNHQKVSKMFKMPPQSFDTFKKRLSNLVFSSDPDGRNYKKELEDFMLPRIQLDIDFWCNYYERKRKQYVIEMPTFFETRGLKKHDDYEVILIVADKDIRVQRILKRNKHLSIQDVLDRMKSQIEQSKKVKFSDKVIQNNGTIDELRDEI